MLNREFHFTIDVCAEPQTGKCGVSWVDGSLDRDWPEGQIYWMNPPYGRGVDLYSWVAKAYQASLAGAVVVALLPSRTDTKWFHEYVLKASEIRFVKDRIHFGNNGEFARANHANMVVIFNGSRGTKISSISNGRNNG